MVKSAYTCFFIVSLMVSWPLLGNGQSAYKGGKGDGFSMAKTPEVTVGMASDSRSRDLKIYPQPALSKESIHIKSSQVFTETTTYQILNMRGKVIKKGNWPVDQREINLQLSSSIPSGVYLLNLISPQGMIQERFTVIKP